MLRNLKIMFLIHAIVALVFGLVMYLMPATGAAWVNWAPVDPVMTQGFGAALLAIAFSSWLGYLADRWEQVRIILQMEIAFAVLGLVAGLYQLLFATPPAFIWVPVVLWAIFAVVWVYFYRFGYAEAHPAAAT